MLFGGRIARLSFEHGVRGAILDVNLTDRDVTPVALLLSAED